MVEKCGVFTPP